RMRRPRTRTDVGGPCPKVRPYAARTPCGVGSLGACPATTRHSPLGEKRLVVTFLVQLRWNLPALWGWATPHSITAHSFHELKYCVADLLVPRGLSQLSGSKLILPAQRQDGSERY